MEKKIAKGSTLLLVLLMAPLLFMEAKPIGMGMPFYHRFLYHFFHANLLHYMFNSWCLVSMVFAFDLPLVDILVAYLVATFVPIVWSASAIGLSGMCFVLLGRCSFFAKDKRSYHSYIGLFLAIGLVVPTIAGFIHLYCYLVGIVYGLLIHPFKWQ